MGVLPLAVGVGSRVLWVAAPVPIAWDGGRSGAALRSGVALRVGVLLLRLSCRVAPTFEVSRISDRTSPHPEGEGLADSLGVRLSGHPSCIVRIICRYVLLAINL